VTSFISLSQTKPVPYLAGFLKTFLMELVEASTMPNELSCTTATNWLKPVPCQMSSDSADSTATSNNNYQLAGYVKLYYGAA
jgi:hypothetical protein